MPAFTFIAQKLSISLVHDTITLYPKTEDLFYKDINSRYSMYYFSEVTGAFKNIDKWTPGHNNLHNDDFIGFLPHTHLKFNAPFTASSLHLFLRLLTELGYLDDKESIAILDKYKATQNILFLKLNETLESLKQQLDELYDLSSESSQMLDLTLILVRVYYKFLDEIETYQSQRTSLSFETFERNCAQILNRAHEELKKLSDASEHQAPLTSLSNSGISFFTKLDVVQNCVKVLETEQKTICQI